MSSRFLKYVALFDIHSGWEIKEIKCKKQKVSTHNLGAIRIANNFIADYKPDVLIYGGDQINCGSISHWNKNSPRELEDLRLQEEYDFFENELLIPNNFVKRKIWMRGNHEQWVHNLLKESPTLEGMLEPEVYFEEYFNEFYGTGDLFRLGKLYFAHGDVPRVSWRYAAKNLVSLYRRSIRVGHFHHLDAATDVTPIDTHDYHTCIVSPALSKRGPSYMKNAPDNHLNGFMYGEVHRKSGDFWDSVAIINNGKLRLNGVSY